MGLSFVWAGQSFGFAYGTISDIPDLMEQVGLAKQAEEYERILGAKYLNKKKIYPEEVSALTEILKLAIVKIEEEQKVRGRLMSYNERVIYEKALKDFAKGDWHSKERPRLSGSEGLTPHNVRI